jgi:hypothetical protein
VRPSSAHASRSSCAACCRRSSTASSDGHAAAGRHCVTISSSVRCRACQAALRKCIRASAAHRRATRFAAVRAKEDEENVPQDVLLLKGGTEATGHPAERRRLGARRAHAASRREGELCGGALQRGVPSTFPSQVLHPSAQGSAAMGRGACSRTSLTPGFLHLDTRRSQRSQTGWHTAITIDESLG